MKKSITISGILLFCCLACSKEESLLSISTETVLLTNADHTATIQIKSNQSWSITGAPAWCAVVPSVGFRNAIVTITVDENHTTASRSAELLIQGGDLTQILVVTQAKAEFSLQPDRIQFEKNTDSRKIKITSNTNWKILENTIPAWCQVEPLVGTGDGEITLTPRPLGEFPKRGTAILKIQHESTYTALELFQESLNAPPSAPILLLPAFNAPTASCAPVFQWQPSVDLDGDPISYRLYLAADTTHWTINEATETTHNNPKVVLQPSTRYYWKVVAEDGQGGQSCSTTWHFMTSGTGRYIDGESRLYQQNTTSPTLNPVNLVFTGDGFVAEDYVDNGPFDQAVQEAAEALFNIEPYRSYREYFKIQKVAAFSAERGCSIEGEIPKNTVFNSRISNNSTRIDCDAEKVYTYAKKAQGITDNELKKMTVIVIINADVYAGTCRMSISGESFAMCPMSTAKGGSSFRNIVCHEAGGHGFGRLLDEYVNYESSLPNSEKHRIETWRKAAQEYHMEYASNISLTGVPESVTWKHFIGKTGYHSVKLFEGAALYAKGVWRSESASCMIDNMLYFNAPSREAIVKRIKQVAGEDFSISDFYAKDIVKSPSSTARTLFHSYEMPLPPLAPPMCIETGR